MTLHGGVMVALRVVPKEFGSSFSLTVHGACVLAGLVQFVVYRSDSSNFSRQNGRGVLVGAGRWTLIMGMVAACGGGWSTDPTARGPLEYSRLSGDPLGPLPSFGDRTGLMADGASLSPIPSWVGTLVDSDESWQNGPEILIGSIAVSVHPTQGYTVARDLITHAERWRLTGTESMARGSLRSDGTLVCGSRSDLRSFKCVDIGTGDLQFETPDTDVYVAPDAVVAFRGDTVVVAAPGGIIAAAINGVDGTVLWSASARSRQTPFVIAGDQVLISGSGGCATEAPCLRVVQLETGVTVAEHPAAEATFLWVDGDTVAFRTAYVSGSLPQTYLYDLKSNKFTEDTTILATVGLDAPGAVTENSPLLQDSLFPLTELLPDGMVYFSNTSKTLICQYDVAARRTVFCTSPGYGLQAKKVRIHPNAIIVDGGGLNVAFVPSDLGGKVASEYATFFGRWGFEDQNAYSFE